jgi:hypothetical protein
VIKKYVNILYFLVYIVIKLRRMREAGYVMYAGKRRSAYRVKREGISKGCDDDIKNRLKVI